MKIKKTVKYHLRFQIIPSKNVAKDAEALARFCQLHGIEEVALIFAAEEWNDGLLSRNQEDLWFDTVKTAKKVLEKAGVRASLNPWTTVLHGARGRIFPPDRHFEPMVSPSGEISKAVASFADKKWRKYVYDLYGRFAELGFRVLWIEDDFRFHNHGPLTWGGGFEQAVIRRFSVKIAQKVSRQEILQAILAPGKPHPWRAIWMQTWSELQLEVAKGIADSVKANSPCDSTIGLMSGNPSYHSTEGRDWHALFEALSIDGRVAHRPNFTGYSDSIGRFRASSIMMLDWQKQFRPAACEVAPEIENFPFTCWTKSDAQTWAEMALCMAHGSSALLLDLFPFSGNLTGEEPRIGELLDRSKPALNWLAERFQPGLTSVGIGLPWKQEASQKNQLEPGAGMPSLNVSPLDAGTLLLLCGIPVSFAPQIVNAVFGKMAWVFNDQELKEMLAGGLLLDGLSAEIMERRGFGDLIGLKVKKLIKRHEGRYAVEEVVCGESGVRAGLYFNSNAIPAMRVLEPEAGAHEWTKIIMPDHKRFGSGLVVFKNRLGGRVVTFAAEDPARLPLNFQRQTMIHSAINFLAGKKCSFVRVTGGPHLMPMCFEDQENLKLVVLNGSPDAACPTVHFKGVPKVVGSATILAPLERPKRAEVTIERNLDSWSLTFDKPVPYLGLAVLELSRS